MIFDFIKNIPVAYFSLLGAFSFILFRIILKIQKTEKLKFLQKTYKRRIFHKKVSNELEVTFMKWVYSELDEWGTAILGAILFILMGEDFLILFCKLGYIEDCYHYYLHSERFWYWFFGAFFGIILLNIISLGVIFISFLGRKISLYLSNGK